MEVMHCLVLDGTGHATKVSHVPDALKVAAAEEEPNLEPLLPLNCLHDLVNLVNLPMPTPHNPDMHPETSMSIPVIYSDA